MVFLTTGFAPAFPEKRLELKSLKGQTKADEEGTPTGAKQRNRGCTAGGQTLS
jgi:hypothetical protein